MWVSHSGRPGVGEERAVDRYRAHRLDRDDAEKAFEEAIGRLKKQYGDRSETADEMLAGVMKGDPITRRDTTATAEFVCRLVSTYGLALETNRGSDFDRSSLITRVLGEKLPFLIETWNSHKVKRGWKRPSFLQFMEFLQTQEEIATLNADVHDAYPAGNRKPAVKVAMTYAEAVDQPAQHPERAEGKKPLASPPAQRKQSGQESGRTQSTRQRGQGAGTPYCYCCDEPEHWTSRCSVLRKKSLKEKLEFLAEKGLCKKCCRRHRVEDCQRWVSCLACGGKHETVMCGVDNATANPVPSTSNNAVGTSAPGQA